jgi:preprotein translocase subunit SecF
MEFFRNTNFDFLGRKWPFIIASLILTAGGLVSLIVKGGPRYGIDFQGGTVMTLKFASAPDESKIRAALNGKLSGAPTVQRFIGGENQISIGTEGADNTAATRNRQVVLDTLEKTYAHPELDKLDFSNASAQMLKDRLRDPLAKAGAAQSEVDLDKLISSILQFRNTPPQSGIITNFSQLSAVPGVTPAVIQILQAQCDLAPFALQKLDFVGPKVGAELRTYAIRATLLALAGMLAYISFRFEWIYGLGAVIAVFHDTIITVGIFSLFNKEIDLTVIAALLTLVGYSMNDTIVIFDRIRENLRMNRRESLYDVINRSVNQTLSRTVMTSGLTFLTVLALFLFGGPVLHNFSFALVVGIIVGTYSSVFIASPIVLFWHDFNEKRRKTSPVMPQVKSSGTAKPAVSGVRKGA